MRKILAQAVALCISAAACSASAPPHAERLQWSESSTFRSPNGLSQIEVKADLNGSDNNSIVILKKNQNEPGKSIFILKRSADLYWDTNNLYAIIINFPFDGESEIFVIPLLGKFDFYSIRNIDKIINKKIRNDIYDIRDLHIRKFEIIEWVGNLVKIRISGRYEINKNDNELYQFEKEYIVNLISKNIE